MTRYTSMKNKITAAVFLLLAVAIPAFAQKDTAAAAFAKEEPASPVLGERSPWLLAPGFCQLERSMLFRPRGLAAGARCVPQPNPVVSP